jgi:hypothetical protein
VVVLRPAPKIKKRDLYNLFRVATKGKKMVPDAFTDHLF